MLCVVANELLPEAGTGAHEPTTRGAILGDVTPMADEITGMPCSEGIGGITGVAPVVTVDLTMKHPSQVTKINLPQTGLTCTDWALRRQGPARRSLD